MGNIFSYIASLLYICKLIGNHRFTKLLEDRQSIDFLRAICWLKFPHSTIHSRGTMLIGCLVHAKGGWTFMGLSASGPYWAWMDPNKPVVFYITNLYQKFWRCYELFKSILHLIWMKVRASPISINQAVEIDNPVSQAWLYQPELDAKAHVKVKQLSPQL